MAIGRISGSVLKSNLTRNGVDLAFETSLLYLDVTNSRVGIGTSEPSTALHVVGNTTITGTLNISGALTAGSFSPDSISVNNLSSADSTAIQINDAVNISGTLNVQGNKISGVQDPTNNQDAATKNYVDTQVVASSSLTVVGDDSTGTVFNAGETIRFEGQGTASVTVTGDTVFINSTASIPPITFVGDDSTGTAINLGETFKIAGASNITTAVSGDTITITGPNLSSYLTNSTITIVGDDSTGVTLNSNETIKIAGTSNITTAVSGDTLTITGPNLTNYAQKSETAITVVGDDSTGTPITFGETFKIAGAGNITTAVSGDTLTITGSKNVDINEISSADSSAIQVNDAVNVSGTLTANTFVTNNISSSESSAIQVDDAMSVQGILTANNLVTNEISSSESSAIQVNDAMNVSGTFTAGIIVTNEISSSDSSAIQINDSVNISGNLSVDTMDVNSLTSSDSSQLVVTDNFRVDGYLQANQLIGDIATLGTIASPVNGSQSVNFQLASTADIWIDNTSSIDFTSGSVGARKVIIIHNTAASNKTVTIQTDGVTKATVTIAAGAANVYELFAISSADKYVVDVGTLI